MSLAEEYNLIDRLLHYVAFANPFILKALCELENDLFKRKIDEVVSEREIFVAGLPRSGTTLILDLLYRTGEFRTFTYRHMPFVLTPILWDKISRPFQRPGVDVERAHSDGMMVSFDSPEAFEEIVWLAYMKDHFVAPGKLYPLSNEEYSKEFADSFRCTIKKLLSLESGQQKNKYLPRYLSKNNANISRIKVIKEIFPSSLMLVPFRNPIGQVSSLMTQHQIFSDEHAKDSFSKRYMEWIGHYEFGQNFKPINFDGWLDNRNTPYEIDKNFWLEYWISAYSYVLKHYDKHLYLVDYDELLRNKNVVLEEIALCVNLKSSDRFFESAKSLRSPTSKPLIAESFSANLLTDAFKVHEQLRNLCKIQSRE